MTEKIAGGLAPKIIEHGKGVLQEGHGVAQKVANSVFGDKEE